VTWANNEIVEFSFHSNVPKTALVYAGDGEYIDPFTQELGLYMDYTDSLVYIVLPIGWILINRIPLSHHPLDSLGSVGSWPQHHPCKPSSTPQPGSVTSTYSSSVGTIFGTNRRGLDKDVGQYPITG
jgi:hypothetical protein